MRGIVLIILISITATAIFGNPSIIEVTDNVEEGQNLIITGLGFGAKETATPLKWDDFDQPEYNVGDNISNGWIGGSDIGSSYHEPMYNQIETRNGSAKHIRTDWPNGGTGNGTDSHCPFYWQNNEEIDTAYVTFWVKYSYDGYHYNPDAGSLNGNVKWFHIAHRRDAGLYIDQYPTIVSSYTFDTTVLDSSKESHKSGMAGEEYISDTTIYHSVPSNKTWVRVEYMLKESSAPNGTFDGTADGSYRIYYQQGGEGNKFSLMANYSGITNSENGTKHWQAISFSDYNRNELMDIMFDYDDIYFDNTFARIEIGDNETFEDCTHREIQIPHTVWNSSHIEITINQGSFADGEDAFLFVVDENGTASDGYPITLSVGTHPADLNSDDDINSTEIRNYVSQWRRNSVSISSLFEAINIWKQG